MGVYIYIHLFVYLVKGLQGLGFTGCRVQGSESKGYRVGVIHTHIYIYVYRHIYIDGCINTHGRVLCARLCWARTGQSLDSDM